MKYLLLCFFVGTGIGFWVGVVIGAIALFLPHAG